MKSIGVLFVVAFVLVLSASVDARTWYVPSECPTIQAGINAAFAGDTVLVACGTYYEHEISMAYDSLCLRSETGQPDCVTIDAQDSGRVISCQYVDSMASIEGFTITGGGNSSLGGGIFCQYSYLTIQNCSITGNSASDNGGGICCVNQSSPTITGCTITGNSASNNGGGICCMEQSSPTIIDCAISENSADYGGGIFYFKSSSSITGCTIFGNSADCGGGIDSRYDSSLTITGCTITGNSASSLGGGIYCYYSSLTITGCTISGDSASNYGGGIDCVSSSVTVKNTILWGDCANYAGGSEVYHSAGSSISFECCDVHPLGIEGEGTVTWIYGNIFTDPMFCEPETCASAPTTAGDYTIDENSFCAPDNSPSGCGLIGALGVGVTVVELTSFIATRYESNVQVDWITATEIDNAGFNLHRSISKEGKLAQINAVLIPAQGTAIEGASYSFTDYDVTNGITHYYWLEDVDLNGNSTLHGPVSATPGLTSVEEGLETSTYNLRLAYSVGRNVSISIAYSIPKECRVSLKIYDAAGRVVRELVNRMVEAGEHRLIWNERDVPSGVYFCRMRTDEHTAIKKIVLLK